MDSARDRLLGLIGGYRVTQLIRTAALLKICDHLAHGPREAADVAAMVHADPHLLRRLMRALVGVGVLDEGEDGRFSNTEIGEHLRSDLPGTLAAPAISLTEDHAWQAWARLHQGIVDGAVPYLIANAATFWDLQAAKPEAAARFNAHMAAQTEAFASQLVNAFDFSQCRTVVDVGGGKGALMSGILSANPGVSGVVFDLEQGLAGAQEYLQRRGVADRCTTVAGDFFKSVVPGGDCYMLRLILHDWDDADAMRILESVRRAMTPGSQLLVIDHVLPARADASPESRVALNMDIHMFVLFGSRERTEADLRQMLAAAGFEVERVAPTMPTRTVVARAV
ncbi:MAG: methyltransferase [Candidatus Dormibacteraceae bacterium]